MLAGFGVGLLYKALNVPFRLWKDTPERITAAGNIDSSFGGDGKVSMRE